MVTNVELERIIKAQAKTIEELSKRIDDLDNSMAEKILKIQTDHDSKLALHKCELDTTVRVSSNTTVQVVTGFFDKLNTRLSDTITENKIRMSIIEDETIKSLQLLVENNVDELKRLSNEMAKPRSVTKTDTARYETANSEIRNDRNLSTKNDARDVSKRTDAREPEHVSLTSLEARIDKLEDFSRRDNLLFTGFDENKDEHCENAVRDLLARKLLNGICDVNKVIIVRAHRLGQFKAGQTRPIIVKFREYCDKQMILQQVYKGKLINSGKWVTEDFSVNTTEDRKYLRSHLKAAKEVLQGQIKTSSVRYKAIHITNIHGKRFVFPLHKVVANSQIWWKVVGAGPETDDISDVTDVDGGINSPTQNLAVGDKLQYPEGSSRPEDIQDIVEEAPAEEPEQDSDGTQNSVEEPKEGAVPSTTAEEAEAP